mmetsp:Transcript_14911/g.25874  ORF Transcript_14911/g.25874 Transcript_14911/m.25874 type:complete len:662 (+) Transcript_14911:1475-3460(+)
MAGILDYPTAHEHLEMDIQYHPQDEEYRTSTVHKGSQLAFRGLNVCVPVKRNLGLGFSKNIGEYKKILEDISGIFEPGELVYIMGPSGSGKSTLMDLLADRVASDHSGTVYINGSPKNQAVFRHISKYVQQEDQFFDMITAQETLRFAQDLFRSKGDPDMKQNRIQNILVMLGLVEQADVIAGGALFKGLSGGQRRRLSVGEALVSAPQILFLDEITSGLDAASSHYVMKVIKRIAYHQNITAIATVHQPSQHLFEFADKLMLLSSGKLAYFGPASHVKQHMTLLGLEKPVDMSLPEWLLFCINSDFEDSLHTKQIVLDGWSQSQAAEQLYRELDNIELEHQKKHDINLPSWMPSSFNNSIHEIASKLTDMGQTALGDSGHGSSWFTQVAVLMHRGFLNLARDPTIIWMRLAVNMMLAIVIGTVWLQLDRDASAQFDWISCLAYTCGYYVFSVIAVVPAQHVEKAIVIKEKSNHAYTVSAFSMARFWVDLPFLAIMSLVCCSIVYWLVGFTNDAGRFFFFVLTFFCGFLAAESFAFLVSAMTPNDLFAILVISSTFGAFMAVEGAMVRLDQIPWAVRWMQYISIQFYILMALSINEFQGNVYPATSQTNPPLAEISGEQILDVLGYSDWNKWVGIGALLAMVVGYRLLATWWMVWRYHGKK